MVAVPANNVLTVKVTVSCPAGTSTLEGTVATILLLLESDTDVPPGEAGPLRRTVPAELVPALTEAGVSVIDES